MAIIPNLQELALKNKCNYFKLGIENSDDLVKEHCINLKCEVQLTVEEVIQ